MVTTFTVLTIGAVPADTVGFRCGSGTAPSDCAVRSVTSKGLLSAASAISVAAGEGAMVGCIVGCASTGPSPASGSWVIFIELLCAGTDNGNAPVSSDAKLHPPALPGAPSPASTSAKDGVSSPSSTSNLEPSLG